MEVPHISGTDPQEPSTSAPTPSVDHPENPSSEVTSSEQIPDVPGEALPPPLPGDLEAPPLTLESSDPSASRQPSRYQPWRTWTRRQVLMGVLLQEKPTMW
jgi:hypothetical protein